MESYVSLGDLQLSYEAVLWLGKFNLFFPVTTSRMCIEPVFFSEEIILSKSVKCPIHHSISTIRLAEYHILLHFASKSKKGWDNNHCLLTVGEIYSLSRHTGFMNDLFFCHIHAFSILGILAFESPSKMSSVKLCPYKTAIPTSA